MTLWTAPKAEKETTTTTKICTFLQEFATLYVITRIMNTHFDKKLRDSVQLPKVTYSS